MYWALWTLLLPFPSLISDDGPSQHVSTIGLIIYVAEDQSDESEFNLFKTSDSGEQTNANVKTDRKAKLDIEQIITTLSAFADTDEENRYFFLIMVL